MKVIHYFPLLLIAAISCNSSDQDADAFGNFEAREVTISSETSGRILEISITEGSEVAQGQIIARIDSSLQLLQLEELKASMRSVAVRMSTIDAQNRVLDEQASNIRLNIDRTSNMVEEKAAPGKQLDDLNNQLSIVKLQKEANETQKRVIRSELEVLSAKKNLLEEQISRFTVKCPVAGSVQKIYSEKGELAAAGRPLLSVADMKNMELKAFISGSQLSEIKPGDSCEVRIDKWPDSFFSYKGYVSAISEKAEFTPKIIQTREERVTLVYEVTVLVINDGHIKNGMPGELFLNKPVPTK